MNCQYCDKFCSNAGSLMIHERSCKSNPNKIRGINRFVYAKANGLERPKATNQFIKAKDDNVILKVSNDTKAKMRNSHTGLSISSETKWKISESRKRFLDVNPSMIPWKMNHHYNGPSYAERYFYKVFDLMRLNYKKEVIISRYHLDILLNDKICIEIDGEQHYKNNELNPRDIKRTEYLNSLGYEVKRIRWSLYMKMNKDEKKEFIKNIIADKT